MKRTRHAKKVLFLFSFCICASETCCSALASYQLLTPTWPSPPTFLTQPLLKFSNVSSVPSFPFRRETILRCHLNAGRANENVERIVDEDIDDPVGGGEACLYCVSSAFDSLGSCWCLHWVRRFWLLMLFSYCCSSQVEMMSKRLLVIPTCIKYNIFIKVVR